MSYPLAYPLASSTNAQIACQSGASWAVSPTKDLRSTRRLSSPKLAAISARLSERDRQVLAAVGRFRVMSGQQLSRLFWPDGLPETRARLARHGLARLSRLGVLAPLPRRVGGVRAGSAGLCFSLGLAGQHLLASGARRRVRSPHTPGERHLRHLLAVAGLYVELTTAERRREAELLAFDPEPDCWRSYTGAYGTRLTLKPDAYLKLGIGEYEHSWLIEVDRATEALTTIARKAQRHLDCHRSDAALRSHGVSPRVAWIVPDQDRAQQVQAALDRLGEEAGELFAVATFAEAVRLLAAEAAR